MKHNATVRLLFPRQLAVLVLASAVGFPALAQQAQPTADPQNTPPVAQQSAPAASPSVTPVKEGFWGRVNPFARKVWVKRQTDPINDRLGELDQVNANNAKDIKDVDARAQAGIGRAQASADAANQTATAAGSQAQQAGATAQGAAGHVNQLNATVSGLDQYRQINMVEVTFRTATPVLSAAARTQLDGLAASLAGHQGYILELEAHSPAAGSTGIQNSQHLAEAVKRYLVTEHQIPVYRLHSVALGNARDAAAGTEVIKPVRSSSVQIRLMENSLAAQEVAPPHGVASIAGAERP
ncbi:MAG: flagellar motor protein MotB [Terracidiphilus sp.]|nr:flagellar motor protein MotB [Terracidiphilus sp.]